MGVYECVGVCECRCVSVSVGQCGCAPEHLCKNVYMSVCKCVPSSPTERGEGRTKVGSISWRENSVRPPAKTVGQQQSSGLNCVSQFLC